MNSTRTRSRSPAVMAPRTPAVKGVSKRSKQKKPVLLTAYLVLYNLCSAAAWAHFALALLHAVSAAQWDISAAGPQKETARLLLWVQSAAVLEIAHAALGLVPSQLLSTTMQICSRLFIVGLAQYTTRPESRWSYALFATAWLLSDLTRYCYYVANLLSLSPAILVWARYASVLHPPPLPLPSATLSSSSSTPSAPLARHPSWHPPPTSSSSSVRCASPTL